MNELIIKTESLPDNPVELAKIAVVGNEFIKSCQHQLKVMNKINVTGQERQKFLEKAQDAAIKLLDVYKKIGELSKTIPSRKRKCEFERDELGRITKCNNSPSGEPPKWQKMGLHNKHELIRCQVIANNQELVEKVIKNAKEENEIPTRSQIVAIYDKTEKYKKVSKMNKTEKISKDLFIIKNKILNINITEDKKFFDKTEKMLENMLQIIKDKKMMDDWKKTGKIEQKEKVKRLI